VSERVERIGNSVIVYDDALVGQISERVFAADAIDIAQAAHATGRGRVLPVTIEGRACILRHYYRGGLVRHFSRDSFVWTGRDATRSFHEYRLLAELRDAGLPVPTPVAARYVRRGAVYTADLITETLASVEPLSGVLQNAPLSAGRWREIGMLVGRFHRANVFHADLNAHNIQVARGGDLFLLDFDRGRMMPGPGAWSERNLQRLRRSLRKINRNDGAHFAESDWELLVEGYRVATAR
jgi:3-deoxy-D-manno-octulosonic acid kinase